MEPHRSLSIVQVWSSGSRRERFLIFASWALLNLLCIALGLATVAGQWSGLPISLGGVTVYLTIYPPLLICLLLTLTAGWWWGAVPAYLATFTLALYAGMPLPWALLFAMSNPLGFAVMAMGFQAIQVRRDLRDLNALLFYIQLSFVSSIFGSSGALIWCYTNSVDRSSVFAIWQGWWLGAFVQSVFIVGPLLALGFGPCARWMAQHARLLAPAASDVRRSVLHLLGAATVGMLTYGLATLRLAGDRLDQLRLDPGSAIGLAVDIQRQSTWVFFWVFALLILFIAFFGYRLFTHWQRSTSKLLEELHRANQQLETLASTDSLSGLLNRRSADQALQAEWHRARRLGSSAALALLDIDHFKQVNDEHGHAAGDEVIRCLAQLIRDEARGMDIAARYGGEEFLVLLPEAHAEGAWHFAERLRQRVQAARPSFGHQSMAFSVSIGLAEFAPDDKSPQVWLQRADQALYQAKREGRNRTVLAAA